MHSNVGPLLPRKLRLYLRSGLPAFWMISASESRVFGKLFDDFLRDLKSFFKFQILDKVPTKFEKWSKCPNFEMTSITETTKM